MATIESLFAIELGPVKVNAVSAAVTTVVGAGVLWLARLGYKGIATWRKSRQAQRRTDHVVIQGGWSYGDLVGTSTEFLACVRAAPSKSLPGPVRLNVDRIAPLVHSAFGDLLPVEPEISLPTEVVRYRKTDSDGTGVGPYMQVWSTGLIEATAPITHATNDQGELVIPLIEIASVLLPAIRVIQRGGYKAAFGPVAEISLGLDWELKLSRELACTPSTPWAALEFPGRAPDGRATDQRPPWPKPGFGHDQLLCTSPATPPEEILLIALADLVERSGYYRTAGAMSDLQDAIRNLPK